MELYQQIQNRTAETVAVANGHLPGLTIAGTTTAILLARANSLSDMAQARDNASVDYDTENNLEQTGYRLLRKYDLQLPAAAEAELDDDSAAEHDLLNLLDEAYSITPRTTELAVERGRKIVSALERINNWLAAQVPARAPITSGGRGVAELIAALGAQPALEQNVETKASLLKSSRQKLASETRAVDRLNKRFYKKLIAEALDNPALQEALGQITTENANQPATLSIKSVLQGGDDQLHILVAYDNGTAENSTQNTVEWWVVGVEAEFAQSAPAPPLGNTLGPFLVGQTVKLRTRTRNANGTTTGSIRSLTLLAPV